MKIWLVGNTSKIAKVIEKSNIAKEYNINKVSQRGTSNLSTISKDDSIIYLVSNTKTKINYNECSEYIYSNCILLTKFIILNNINECNFIYFSTAKIYNLFNDKTIYNEEDKFEDIPSYNKLKEIAQNIIKLVQNNPLIENNNSELHKITEDILKLPRIDKYFPIYEYTKIISELIIRELLDRAYILRPTYLYGDNEYNNIIYKLIDYSANGKDIEISSGKKDFVHYDTLLSVLEKIIDRKTDRITTINISQNINIENETLIYFANEISSIVNKPFKIKEIEKCKKNYNVDNKKMKQILNKTYIESFEKCIRFIIYRYYLRVIRKLNIISEYIGGSFACTYLVENIKKQKCIIKLCIGNGADNGNIKMINEAKQMKAIYDAIKSENYNITVPNIFNLILSNNWTIIEEEYIEGETYTDIFYKNTDINYLCMELDKFCMLMCSIYNIDKINEKSNMLLECIKRSEYRLQQVKNYPNNVKIFEDYEFFNVIRINDKLYKNPLKVLGILKKYNISYENLLGLCISGDSILDNIIVKEDKLYLIDSRGEDLVWNNNKPYFDPYYDFGKILFYFVAWSTIRQENFKLITNNYTLKENESYLKLNNETQKIFDILKYKCFDIFLKCKKQLTITEEDNIFIAKIVLMAGVHFLSDTYPRIVGKGKNPINECYAEFLVGTMLINNFYKYLENEIELNEILNIGEVND